jgi:probable rRNA maturation factor
MLTSSKNPRVVLQQTNHAHRLPRESDLADAISDVLRMIMQELGFADLADNCETGVTITTDAEIRLINAEHRGISKPTDVLSFPVLEREDIEYAQSDGPPVMLGDIVLSTDTIKAQADERGMEFPERFVECLVHGILHLLGWRHGDDAEREKMEEMEDRLVPKAIEVMGK